MNRMILFIVLGLVAFFGYSGLYTIDETQQVVITRFGEAIGEPITEPGLKFKIPLIQNVNFFPRNLLEWDGDPGQVPTADKTFIWVDVFARWKIVDALKYFEKVNNETRAHSILDGIIDAAVRNRVTSNNLRETVRNTDREMYLSEGRHESDGTISDSSLLTIELGRSQMARQILAQALPKLESFGIELVEVRFKRINYVEKILKNVFERMIAERKQIAEKYRSEGRGESSRIDGEREKKLKRITSEAYREAQGIKGKADAEATRIYAGAYEKDPEFYSFVQSLHLYRHSLDSTTRSVFSTRSDFLKYLKKYEVQR